MYPVSADDSAAYIRLILRCLEGECGGCHSPALRRLAWRLVYAAAQQLLQEAAELCVDPQSLGCRFLALPFTEMEFGKDASAIAED